MSKRAALITAFNPSAFKGGIETYTLHLMALLEDRGLLCDLYCLDADRPASSFRNSYLGDLYALGRKVFDRRNDYDLVIANGFYGFGCFPPPARTVNIFHATHKGFAGAIREVVPHVQYVEWRCLWGDFCESMSGYGRRKIAVSGSVRDELQQEYGLSDIRLLHNGVDTGLFRKVDRAHAAGAWKIPAGVPVGLYVGRWDRLKGADLLEMVMQARPDICWVIVLGTGSDRTLVPASQNVIVLEQVGHELMHEIYSAADFLLFPSRYEGFGYVIIEAMACELPVITTPVGIAKTICREMPFKDLLLPDPRAAADRITGAAGACIDRVLSDADFRKRVAGRGRKRVEEDFSIDRWKKDAAEVLGI
ncbi:MAG: glycosyltransferase family 4 protein [Thermodesulfovibrionales bacterium]